MFYQYLCITTEQERLAELFFNCCIPESLARAGLRLGGAHDRALFGCSSDMHTIRDGFVSILVVRQTCVYMYIYKHISCMYVYVYEYIHIASICVCVQQVIGAYSLACIYVYKHGYNNSEGLILSRTQICNNSEGVLSRTSAHAQCHSLSLALSLSLFVSFHHFLPASFSLALTPYE